jgi:hypothetical protein
MKTSKAKSTASQALQKLRLTIAAKHAGRRADLSKRRAQLAKAAFKAAKRAFKLARKTAKKAAKKARRLEEGLAVWLKRQMTRPEPERKQRTATKRATRKSPPKKVSRVTRVTRKKASTPAAVPASTPQFPTAEATASMP